MKLLLRRQSRVSKRWTLIPPLSMLTGVLLLLAIPWDAVAFGSAQPSFMKCADARYDTVLRRCALAWVRAKLSFLNCAKQAVSVCVISLRSAIMVQVMRVGNHNLMLPVSRPLLKSVFHFCFVKKQK